MTADEFRSLALSFPETVHAPPVLDCFGRFQPDGPRQLLIDQEAGATSLTRPPAARPRNAAVRPAGDDHFRVAVEAACLVTTAERRRRVGAVHQLDEGGSPGHYGALAPATRTTRKPHSM
jgi:hypothetical protein